MGITGGISSIRFVRSRNLKDRPRRRPDNILTAIRLASRITQCRLLYDIRFFLGASREHFDSTKEFLIQFACKYSQMGPEEVKRKISSK